MVKSTNGQSSLFPPTTSEDSGSVTSSPASAGGPTRSGSLAGLTTERSGPGVGPVNRSRDTAPKLAGTIRATFGLSGASSLRSAALQSSLVNRLKQRLDTAGSIVFALTWKKRTTPSGRVLCPLPGPARSPNPRRWRLRASAHSIRASGCGWWPTPDAKTATHSPGVTLTDAANLTAWRTPNASDAKLRATSERMIQHRLRKGQQTGSEMQAPP